MNGYRADVNDRTNDLLAELQAAASRSETVTPVNYSDGTNSRQPPVNSARTCARCGRNFDDKASFYSHAPCFNSYSQAQSDGQRQVQSNRMPYHPMPHGLPIARPSNGQTKLRMCSICGLLFDTMVLNDHMNGCGVKLRCQRVNGCGQAFETVRHLNDHVCHKQHPIQSLVNIFRYQQPGDTSSHAMESAAHPPLSPSRSGKHPKTFPVPAAESKARASAEEATPQPRSSGAKYTKEDNALLKRLKDVEGKEWSEIEQHFPGRSLGSLQVHWCTKLKEKTVDEVATGPHPSAATTRAAAPSAASRENEPPQISSDVVNGKAKTAKTATPNKTAPGTQTSGPRVNAGRYSVEEQILIKRLKEEDNLNFEAIHAYLPARAPLSLQVHYYTKLKKISKEELQKRLEMSKEEEEERPKKKQKLANAQENAGFLQAKKAKDTVDDAMTTTSGSPADPSYAVQKLLVGIAQKHPETRPLPPMEIARLRNELQTATQQGGLMPYGTGRAIQALDNLLGNRVEEQLPAQPINRPPLAVSSSTTNVTPMAEQTVVNSMNADPYSSANDTPVESSERTANAAPNGELSGGSGPVPAGSAGAVHIRPLPAPPDSSIEASSGVGPQLLGEQNMSENDGASPLASSVGYNAAQQEEGQIAADVEDQQTGRDQYGAL